MFLRVLHVFSSFFRYYILIGWKHYLKTKKKLKKSDIYKNIFRNLFGSSSMGELKNNMQGKEQS